jgi:hypothetical protein
MFKSFAIAVLLAEVSAINIGHHHHHHRHHQPKRHMMVMDDPTCTTSQETGHCLLSHYKDEGAIAHPIDYPVPNFGPDQDVQDTLKLAADAEQELNHEWVISFEKPPPGPPMDYFVPNFGVDQDIKDSHDNLAVAEAQLKHNFTLPKSTAVRKNDAVPPVQWPSSRELDHDVQSTLAHAEAAEAALDHKWEIQWN